MGRRGGVDTMENKDTNTDYQKFVRAGEQTEKLMKLQLESFPNSNWNQYQFLPKILI